MHMPCRNPIVLFYRSYICEVKYSAYVLNVISWRKSRRGRKEGKEGEKGGARKRKEGKWRRREKEGEEEESKGGRDGRRDGRREGRKKRLGNFSEASLWHQSWLPDNGTHLLIRPLCCSFCHAVTSQDLYNDVSFCNPQYSWEEVVFLKNPQFQSDKWLKNLSTCNNWWYFQYLSFINYDFVELNIWLVNFPSLYFICEWLHSKCIQVEKMSFFMKGIK